MIAKLRLTNIYALSKSTWFTTVVLTSDVNKYGQIANRKSGLHCVFLPFSDFLQLILSHRFLSWGSLTSCQSDGRTDRLNWQCEKDTPPLIAGLKQNFTIFKLELLWQLAKLKLEHSVGYRVVVIQKGLFWAHLKFWAGELFFLVTNATGDGTHACILIPIHTATVSLSHLVSQ